MGLSWSGRAAHSRRVRELRIGADDWLEFFRQLDGSAVVRVQTAIPQDARVVWVTTDQGFGSLSLYVESESFEEVEDAVPPPLWDIALERWDLPTWTGYRGKESG